LQLEKIYEDVMGEVFWGDSNGNLKLHGFDVPSKMKNVCPSCKQVARAGVNHAVTVTLCQIARKRK